MLICGTCKLFVDADVRLGELLEHGDTTKSSTRGTSGKFEGGRNPLPIGINKKGVDLK